MTNRDTIGIDLGSRTTKIVHLTGGKIRHREIFDTGHDPLAGVKQALERIGSADIIATGYGRYLLSENLAARRVTEIKACGRGVYERFPGCRTILDVGGQDCKVIRLNGKGKVVDFEMNDRCAAGTGKFLEVMAQSFDMDIEAFVRMAQATTESITINSMCTVFAESEVISLITSGKPKEQIALGLHQSIAERLQAMLSRMPLEEEIVFVGGGAKNSCLHSILQEKLKQKILRPPDPQLITAHGAALLAGENGEL